MFRRFWNDVRGNYVLMTSVAIVPIMGALALAVDYTELSRQRYATMHALDAAGIATARRIVEGATDEQAKTYAKEFFEANLKAVSPTHATLSVVLPNNNTGGGTLKLSAALTYEPTFLPAAAMLIGKSSSNTEIDFTVSTEIRLKNTLEVALVLDNSGSMDYIGTGSGKKRIVLLKEAAKQLVDTIAAQAAQMKQVEKPVQFGLVPFAASVNIGPDKATAAWMDQDGISPIHHENFNWSVFDFPNRKVQQVGGVWYKKGSDWGEQENQKMTRFQLYQDLRRVTGYNGAQSSDQGRTDCIWHNGSKFCPTYGSYASWRGCVESRPSPYNNNDHAAVSSIPATMFVPMFAPDETDKKDSDNRSAESNWWPDLTTSSGNTTRQTYTPKYYTAAPWGTDAASGDDGPNASCTTNPITPLIDVSTDAGLASIKASIDAMAALGATNVPEGMAWGWRVVSGGAPFTEGRPDVEKGNDKVVIVLTDGANTYYTPNSLGYNDLAGNKSTYSAYGYAGRTPAGYSYPRIFLDTPTTVSKTDYSNSNYTKAFNAQFETLCANAKAANVLVMTVSLDLDETKSADKAQMDALRACSSNSRFRRGTDGQPAKLFWNATGSNLAEKFKEIADELSNLRIVS